MTTRTLRQIIGGTRHLLLRLRRPDLLGLRRDTRARRRQAAPRRSHRGRFTLRPGIEDDPLEVFRAAAQISPDAGPAPSSS
jgi:hypothetical protein